MEQEQPKKVRRYTLREARKRLTTLKQYQAAELIGVSKGTMIQWEQGRNLPNSKYIDRICEVYGCYRGQLILKTRKELEEERQRRMEEKLNGNK